jgi:hypothetical protein
VETVTEEDAWARDPQVLDRIFRAALAESDAQGMVAALRLLAVCAPKRASALYDTIRDALEIRDA